ncbi:MAG: efflux RND transporter periplasmic adaptor subunit [Alphaproteobacteria bacterium]|nr:efflux RND transporter periplasmic adaptor subunit [Alphaproteobacteria bacterium]
MIRLAALSVFLVLSAAMPAHAQATQGNPPPAVSVVVSAVRELVDTVEVTGTLVPREEVLVVSENEGVRIVDVLVEEGDEVREGQILARLSRDLLDAQLAQNAATLARADASIAQARAQIVQAEAAGLEAKQALDRARSLRNSGNATEAVLEQRISAARSAEGRLAAARDGLSFAVAEKAQIEAQKRELMVRAERSEVKAPRAGVISRRTARIGQMTVAGGEPLFRIVADGKIELEAEILETRVASLAEGQAAHVVVGNATYEGSVRLVPAEIDRTTRLGKLRVALPRDPALRIGAFARATIETARRTAIAVPVTAIVYADAGPSVQVVEGSKIATRPVVTGLVADGYVEIREGLPTDQRVVARAAAFLRAGDEVRAILAPATPAGAR